MKGSIWEIDYHTAVNFILPKHYSGRVPTISKAFGWYDSKNCDYEKLKAVVTFGKPASPPLCVGLCGEQYAENVYELNRLVRVDDWKEPLSQFLGGVLRRLRAENWIIVSFSDTEMNHHGYIYQACNFLYTGCTKERTDKFTLGGAHARHYKNSEQTDLRKVRSAKHRYVYFCTFNKRLKKEWEDALRYPILPYPKGDNNEDYMLGDYLKTTLIDSSGNRISVEPEKSNQISLF